MTNLNRLALEDARSSDDLSRRDEKIAGGIRNHSFGLSFSGVSGVITGTANAAYTGCKIETNFCTFKHAWMDRHRKAYALTDLNLMSSEFRRYIVFKGRCSHAYPLVIGSLPTIKPSKHCVQSVKESRKRCGLRSIRQWCC